MKILFIGEYWHIHMIHSKGFDSFTSSKYEEGADYLLSCLRQDNIDVDYMPAHIVQTRFPQTAEALACYDAIVISDIVAIRSCYKTERFIIWTLFLMHYNLSPIMLLRAAVC